MGNGRGGTRGRAVWAALLEAREQTGLVPFLLAGLDETTARTWDSGELQGRCDISRLDHIDAARVLADLWDSKMHVGHKAEWGRDEAPESVALIEAQIAPFSRLGLPSFDGPSKRVRPNRG